MGLYLSENNSTFQNRNVKYVLIEYVENGQKIPNNLQIIGILKIMKKAQVKSFALILLKKNEIEPKIIIIKNNEIEPKIKEVLATLKTTNNV